jgi:peptide chain release factor 2
MDKSEIQKKIDQLEQEMYKPDFWSDKDRAQGIIAEIQDLKDELEGFGKYDRGNAILSIFTGAGGDDAEDFSRMLLHMYTKYIESQGWTYFITDEHKTDNGGYRSVSLKIEGNGAYGNLKNESGVHRLVRLSPFNAKSKRNTSFSMVEVLPVFKKADFKIPETDLDISFAKSGGAGGQNVNKRETAVRIVHTPTGLSVNSSSQRSQEANREEAMSLIQAKVWKKAEEDQKNKERGLAISASTDNEWGSQIRSYVLHPYKMVKDHRTGVEISQVEKVLEDGTINEFVEAERGL